MSGPGKPVAITQSTATPPVMNVSAASRRDDDITGQNYLLEPVIVQVEKQNDSQSQDSHAKADRQSQNNAYNIEYN